MWKKRLLSQSRELMTLPDERYRAIAAARELLFEIANPGGRWKRVPKELKLYCRHALRHYPTHYDMKEAAVQAPDLFQERIEPLTRMIMVYDQEQKEEQNGK
jgi:hypothetical protein